MGLNKHSDYGSGSSSETFTPWGSQDMWPEFRASLEREERPARRRTSSYTDEPRSLDIIMQEFRMNGFDSPYEPEQTPDTYTGLSASCQYLRQRSWPEAASDKRDHVKVHHPPRHESPSAHQLQVLSSLPNAVLYSLLRELEQTRAGGKKQEELECRFCKNNGERASFYRSHRLRSRGRVSCPVLRAYTCRRCGAHGDHAHTIKYCPLATNDERLKSAAMMRSVRMASGRRRGLVPAPSSDARPEYVVFGETTPSALTDGADYNNYELDPLWEALERKLMF
ncbi:unnamed protein product [Danaus chrysippus]|uniref:(African queen) hypothetical protein n=1 Tax=Danaus chrysippus TaxID=151541 RepID=A0A8J2R0H8_9NEOP|nr:unnamed protein product [Danaus chrysippus]